MKLSTRPFLVVYVAWHPKFRGGRVIARALYDHYRRKLYENVAGGTGLGVVYRSAPEPGSNLPAPINFDEAETSAIVLLMDKDRAIVSNYFPWPVHISLSPEEVTQWCEDLSGVAELIFLTVDGNVISLDERRRIAPRQPTDEEWAVGLTAMRGVLTDVSDARVVLGGKVTDFKGRMPGVAEEALAALRARQPLFLLGGFGGCARDIAVALGLLPAQPVGRRLWVGIDGFSDFTAESLNNGLNAKENALLARTVHVDQAVTLLLRGLLRGQGGVEPVRGAE